MDKSWILVGMMGAGKSSVGRLLSQMTGRQHLDTDTILQQRLGRPIPELFKIYGEAAFRDHETSILRGLQVDSQVISTGGGIVLRPENWVEMNRLGITVYLEAGVERLEQRLRESKKRRPMLEVEDWPGRLRSLLEQRKPLYEQADVKVQLGDLDIRACADRVLAALEAAS